MEFDGRIELVDPVTQEALNLTLLVQSKASTLPFPGETDTSFRYTCRERDLHYWLGGNATVILVLSHPDDNEAWWVDIQDAFADTARRASRTVTVDKRRQVFDASAAPELLRRAMKPRYSYGADEGPGRPISEAESPFVLDVHEAITPFGDTTGLPALPPYVPRQHDGDLEKIVQKAAAGDSGIALLLGNSSTGKTRSAWEQVHRLPSHWRLWHPASPDELVERLPSVGAHTVLWLNELPRYLYTDDIRRDETIAAGLSETLRNPDCALVLILGTLWHEYRLRLAPAEVEIGSDTRPNTRILLTGNLIPVPETFGAVESGRLAEAAVTDARLAEALARAEEGHITQYLAGGPAQIQRYRTADPAARAVLHAAMDARRFGWGEVLPAGFLAAAAQSYLTGLQRATLPIDWFDRALKDYLLPLCQGARGPLSPAGDDFRLADYLEQHGKRTRQGERPPDGFWAAALHDDVAGWDTAAMARAAYRRDRREIAHRLALEAAVRGDRAGLATFASMVEEDEGRDEALPYLELAAENGDTRSQLVLGHRCEDSGDYDAAKAWYSLADDGTNPQALVGLASLHARQGRHEVADKLYQTALANGGAREVEYQARDLAERDEHDEALRLAEDSFRHGNRKALTGLAWRYTGPDLPRAFAVMRRAMELGFDDAITEMVILATTANDPALVTKYCDLASKSGHPNAQRVAGHILARSGDERRGAALLWRAFNGGLHWSLFELAELRERQGRVRAARRIYRRLTSVGQIFALVNLAASYERAGDQATAEHLAATYARLDHLGLKDSGWRWVAKARYQRGDHAGAKRLLERMASAGDTHVLVTMAEWAIETGDRPAAEAAVNRAIDSGAPGAKKLLLKLRQSGRE